MKKLLLLFAFPMLTLSAHTFNVHAGPFFNYTRIDFDAPKDLEGYMGGVKAGLGYTHKWFYSNADFEGSWNAGPITGKPFQRSEVAEYFAEIQMGPRFCYSQGRGRFIPFIGFGWNRLRYRQEPDMFNLLYEYDKLFIPVGFHLSWAFSPFFTLGSFFEWRPDVYSRLDVLSSNLHNDKENAFRAELPLIVTMNQPCQCFSLSFVPFFDWSKYGEDTVTNSFGASMKIPDLTRWNLGLRLLAKYEF